MTRILAFSGSARADSFNQKTVNAITQKLNCDVTQLNLKDLALPLYDGDEEASDGLPQAAKTLRALIREHDGLIIGCPEYNGFMTPLLINSIDWSTRSEEGQPDTSIYKDKVVLITSTSPGALAGIRAATHLRTMLSGIGALVIPDVFSVPASFQAFDKDGLLVDEALRTRAAITASRLLSFAQRINGGS